MVKKKPEHGPLYEHARQELERAGVLGGKGNLDQKVYHTTLKLIDTYEKAATSQLLANTIGNLFATLSQGEIINPPTDDVDEWQLIPTLQAIDGTQGHTSVLRRCKAFRSDDAGVTWYRRDTGADGVSEVVTEEENDHANEKAETIQPPKSE